jgi:hypothetical protein
MKWLIGCERSGRVRDALLKRGHDAWSCDLEPSETPGPHLQCDILTVLHRDWDRAIFFPDCTYLAVSGLHWNKRRPGRAALTEKALEFVRKLMAVPFPHGLENPIGCISSKIRKPDQIIQPWQFGENASKATCLWLKGLPPLKPTKIIAPKIACCGKVLPEEVGKYGCPNCNGTGRKHRVWANQTPSGQNKLGPSPERAMERARTYEGISEAMADQWSLVA